MTRSFGHYCAIARELGTGILISANSFWIGNGFRLGKALEHFEGLDLALDSAGFAAMFRYGGYRWNLDQYVELAHRLKPTWWAAPDYCCEPEIASNRAEVLERVMRTAFKLDWARAVASDRGVAPPMPVLQGWLPEDYMRCADLIGELPELVGIGSVCRRDLGGDAGLIRIVQFIDMRLPPHVKLHLFGAKGTAVRAFAGHPRIHSIDSQAWDFGARMRAADRTIQGAGQFLRHWVGAQNNKLGLFGK